VKKRAKPFARSRAALCSPLLHTAHTFTTMAAPRSHQIDENGKPRLRAQIFESHLAEAARELKVMVSRAAREELFEPAMAIKSAERTWWIAEQIRTKASHYVIARVAEANTATGEVCLELYDSDDGMEEPIPSLARPVVAAAAAAAEAAPAAPSSRPSTKAEMDQRIAELRELASKSTTEPSPWGRGQQRYTREVEVAAWLSRDQAARIETKGTRQSRRLYDVWTEAHSQGFDARVAALTTELNRQLARSNG